MPIVVQVRRFPGLRAVVGFAAIAALAIAAHELGGPRRSGTDVRPFTAPALAVAEEAPVLAVAEAAPSVDAEVAAAPVVDAEGAGAAAVESPAGGCTLPAAPPVPVPDGWIRRVDATHHVIDRASLDAALANPSALLHAVRVLPYFTDGAQTGFRIYAVRPGRPFALLGLCNGDVLLTFDGLDLASPDDALTAYHAMLTDDHHELTLRRRGRLLTLHYTIAAARTGAARM